MDLLIFCHFLLFSLIQNIVIGQEQFTDYANSKTLRVKRNPPTVQTATTVAELIEAYKVVPGFQRREYDKTRRENPLTELGAIVVNENMYLPAYIKAEIRPFHLKPKNSRVNFGTDVDNYMIFMGKLPTDERGHLLAHSLGGSSNSLNVVPMAARLNKHMTQIKENRLANIPASYWRSNEEYIKSFLEENPNSYVLWNLGVIYPENFRIAGLANYRPIAFRLQYTVYDQSGGKFFESPEIRFINDNDFNGGYEESY